MNISYKPIGKSIVSQTIDGDEGTLSHESVLQLCDILLTSSYLEFDGATYTTMKLPDFICMLNNRYEIDLTEIVNHYKDDFFRIMQIQIQRMNNLIDSI